jgi:hypothetical protein
MSFDVSTVETMKMRCGSTIGIDFSEEMLASVFYLADLYRN